MRYTLKDLTIEAIQWDGENGLEINNFTEGRTTFEPIIPMLEPLEVGQIGRITTKGVDTLFRVGWWVVKIADRYLTFSDEDFKRTFDQGENS